MWSLPDISHLNAVAAKNAAKVNKIVRTGREGRTKVQCECKSYDGAHCSGEVHVRPYFDVFSDDPKGVLALCEHHEGYYGSPCEGYFECAHCNRVFVENYTWEVYKVSSEDGDLCLNCAREEYVDDPDNWISVDKALKLSDKGLFELCRQARHLFAVGQDREKVSGLKFIDNCEFDSYGGGQISGDNVRDVLQKVKDSGKSECLIILDAAYQFAVSIGVYVAQDELAEAK